MCSGQALTVSLLIVHQGAGLGRIKPNVLVMGFKQDWRTESPQAAHSYISILQWVLYQCSWAAVRAPITAPRPLLCSSDAFDLQYGVCVLRMRDGLDISCPPQSHGKLFFSDFRSGKLGNPSEILLFFQSIRVSTEDQKVLTPPQPNPASKQALQVRSAWRHSQKLYELHENEPPYWMFAAPDIAELVPQPSTVFQKSQAKKTIDVYWLSDDGGLTTRSFTLCHLQHLSGFPHLWVSPAGLTLLLPYLLTRRKRWARCKVRVFVGGDSDKKEEQRNE